MSLFLIAASALAGAQAAPAPAPPAKPARAKMVCVDNTPLGSRIPGTRICHTAAEWQLLRRDDRDETERSQRLNTIHG